MKRSNPSRSSTKEDGPGRVSSSSRARLKHVTRSYISKTSTRGAGRRGRISSRAQAQLWNQFQLVERSMRRIWLQERNLHLRMMKNRRCLRVGIRPRRKQRQSSSSRWRLCHHQDKSIRLRMHWSPTDNPDATRYSKWRKTWRKGFSNWPNSSKNSRKRRSHLFRYLRMPRIVSWVSRMTHWVRVRRKPPIKSKELRHPRTKPR